MSSINSSHQNEKNDVKEHISKNKWSRDLRVQSLGRQNGLFFYFQAKTAFKKNNSAQHTGRQ